MENIKEIKKQLNNAKYISLLYKQFCDAYKLEYVDDNLAWDYDLFKEWLNDYHKLLLEYSDFLYYFTDVYELSQVREVNKGKYDSLRNTGIEVISPYASTFMDYLVDSSIDETKNDVVIIERSGIMIPDAKDIIYTPEEYEVKTLITHNPYSEEYLRGFDKFHNNGRNICIGVFGDISDYDRDKKENLIKTLYNYIPDTKMLYETDDNKYMYILQSNRRK